MAMYSASCLGMAVSYSGLRFVELQILPGNLDIRIQPQSDNKPFYPGWTIWTSIVSMLSPVLDHAITSGMGTLGQYFSIGVDSQPRSRPHHDRNNGNMVPRR